MTMSNERIANFLLLPELKLKHFGSDGLILCEKESEIEVCPKCAIPCSSVYDHRYAKIRDESIRQLRITLKILKRRFWCKGCEKPFTEPVPGVIKGRRTTQRFRNAVMEACENYSDLKAVRDEFKVSFHFIYSAYYEILRLRRRMAESAPWPKRLGIDEHGFGKNKKTRRTQFVSVLVNHDKRKVFDVVLGKTQAELEAALKDIPGRENVEYVSMDMCDPYRNFIQAFFPQAKIVADKFHVLRLLSPTLLRKRKEITGTRADARAKGLLLMSSKNLTYSERLALCRFLERFPELKEVYEWKERLHRFYRIKGYYKAYKAYKQLTFDMALSLLPEIQTLRNTLLKWKEEILNYFASNLTNARLEGFNNKAKVLKRRAYGYRSYENYRLQVLNACS